MLVIALALVGSLVFSEWCVHWMPTEIEIAIRYVSMLSTFFIFCFAFEAICGIVKRENIKAHYFELVGAIFVLFAIFAFFKAMQQANKNWAFVFMFLVILGVFPLAEGLASIKKSHNAYRR